MGATMYKKDSDYLIIISVGNDNKKEITEKYVRNYVNLKNVVILPDSENGQRIGSGGFLLKTVKMYFRQYNRIAVILSGGFNKRSVGCSFVGKIFSNIIYQNSNSVLLEPILNIVDSIMSKISSGILVYCGDILFELENFNCYYNDNIGFAAYADINTATKHGVMIGDENGILKNYIQKGSLKYLSTIAKDLGLKKLPVDTGTFFLNSDTVRDLFNIEKQNSLVNTLLSENLELNMYEDIYPIFSKNFDERLFIGNEKNDSALYQIRKVLAEGLRLHTLRVETGDKGFFHFGTNQDYLNNTLAISKSGDRAFINSYIGSDCSIGKGTVVSNSLLESDVLIGNGCIITNLSVSHISVPDNTIVCGIKLNDGSFVAIVCETSFDFKSVVNGIEMWNMPLFYRGKSLYESFRKYENHTEEEKVSLCYCSEHINYNFFYNQKENMENMLMCKSEEQYFNLRRNILENYFANLDSLKKVECVKNSVTVHFPVRVNISGTWTDAMPYCTQCGGQVINMAVLVNGKMPVCVRAEKTEKNVIEFVSDNKIYEFDLCSLSEDIQELSAVNLHIAALKVLGFTNKTEVCGGFRLQTDVTGIDRNSGLGVSSILLGGCIIAMCKLFGIKKSHDELMNMIFVAEQVMKTGGGWQDQAGGLNNSIKINTSMPGIEQKIQTTIIPLSENFRQILNTRLVIIPTGKGHIGADIVIDVMKRYLSGNKEPFKLIRLLNQDVLYAIEKDDISKFCECINMHFEILKRISPIVSNEKIEKIVEFCLKHVDGISILGAGGGGYLFGVMNERTSFAEFQEQFKNCFPEIKSEIKHISICDEIDAVSDSYQE